MDGAHPSRQAGGADRNPVAHRHRAGQHRAGDHRAGPCQNERAVNRETEAARAIARGLCGAFRLETLTKGRDAFAGHGRDRQDRCLGQSRAGERGPDLGLDLAATGGVGEIGLGQDHEALPQAEQVGDGEVFARLGHHAVVGGDDQHQEVDAGGARHHGADEALVARNVDEAHRVAIRGRPIGEAEVDGDAALLFLGQAVGVGAGQGANERRLAVVDMTCGTDDQAVPPSGTTARRSASAMPAASLAPRAVGR